MMIRNSPSHRWRRAEKRQPPTEIDGLTEEQKHTGVRRVDNHMPMPVHIGGDVADC